MKKLSKWIFIWITASCSYVFSQTYFLKAPQTSMIEFLSFLEMEQALPYSQQQLKFIRKSSQSAKNDLISLLEQAQKSFLKDHLKSASEYFTSIIQQAYSRDWDEEARKIIFYSFLRLAQIESKEESSDSFLHSAVVLDPSLEADPRLFPPPMAAKIKEIKKNLPRASVRFKNIFPFHEVLLINGKETSLQEKIKLPYGEYRVTALSSSHEKWSQTASLSQLMRNRAAAPAWVQGSCTQAAVPGNLENYGVVFPGSCIWKKPFPHTLQNQVLSQKARSGLKNTKNHQSPYSKWVLAGAGAVIIAVIAVPYFKRKNTPLDESSDRSKKSSKASKVRRPSIKIGF